MVTIQEIAKIAGVTDMTVSRVLSGQTMGKRRDAKERAERILRIARELGYQPSNIAKSLRDGRSRTLGMVIGGLSLHHFGCVAETAVDEASRLGYKMLLQVPRWGRLQELEGLEELLRYRVDGILYACHLPEEAVDIHRRLLESHFPLLTLESNGLGFSSVRNDYSVAIAAAVAHLAKRGHKEIALSSTGGCALRARMMEDVFSKACRDVNLKASHFHTIQAGDIVNILELRPTAVLVDGELMMNSFMKGAAAIPGYKPDAVGFYTEWSWVRHNPGIVGAIMVEDEPRIREVIRSLVSTIEGGDLRSGAAFKAKFFSSHDFGSIRYKPLDLEPLYQSPCGKATSWR